MKMGWEQGNFTAVALGLYVLFASGCTPCRGELEVVSGPAEVGLGQSLELRYLYRGEASEKPCELYWEVNGVLGGDSVVGTLVCGVYTAPDQVPEEPVVVWASALQPNTCMDCCPYATLELSVLASRE